MPKLTKAEMAAIEKRITNLPEPDLTDPDNPEWTEADFAKATGPEGLPAHVLAAFPKTRGRGRPKKDDAKRAVSLRLSPDVLAHYRAMGSGWQGAINEALRRTMERDRE